ncbi:MAG TPA: hypothetical protein VFS67_04255 [Polyangiaceae bacterium]|nr:hypothetical protein [Polyangiaceae bacterium]
MPIPAAEPQRVAAYVAPAECPARATWLEGLRARLPPLLRTHPLIESFEVHIDRLGGPEGYRGTLQGKASEEQSQREVNGSSCDEVVDALSFIAALEFLRAEPSAPVPREAAPVPVARD